MHERGALAKLTRGLPGWAPRAQRARTLCCLSVWLPGLGRCPRHLLSPWNARPLVATTRSLPSFTLPRSPAIRLAEMEVPGHHPLLTSSGLRTCSPQPSTMRTPLWTFRSGHRTPSRPVQTAPAPVLLPSSTSSIVWIACGRPQQDALTVLRPLSKPIARKRNFVSAEAALQHHPGNGLSRPSLRLRILIPSLLLGPPCSARSRSSLRVCWLARAPVPVWPGLSAHAGLCSQPFPAPWVSPCAHVSLQPAQAVGGAACLTGVS